MKKMWVSFDCNETWWQDVAWAKKEPTELSNRSKVGSFNEWMNLVKFLGTTCGLGDITVPYIVKSRRWHLSSTVTKHYQCRNTLTSSKIYIATLLLVNISDLFLCTWHISQSTLLRFEQADITQECTRETST